MYNVHCTVGWSDFYLFAMFENRHTAVGWLHFDEFNSKKTENLEFFLIFSFSNHQRKHFRVTVNIFASETLRIRVYTLVERKAYNNQIC